MNNVIKAILDQNTFTATEFNDIANHGADTGWDGFTWCSETEAFYDKHEDLINEVLEDLKEDCYGDEVSMIQMLKGFGRGKDLTVVTAEFEYDEEEEDTDFDDYTFDVNVIWEQMNDNCEMEAIEKDTAYKNLMAWFLLEEGARQIQQMLEEGEIEKVEAMGIDCSEWKVDL